MPCLDPKRGMVVIHNARCDGARESAAPWRLRPVQKFDTEHAPWLELARQAPESIVWHGNLGMFAHCREGQYQRLTLPETSPRQAKQRAITAVQHHVKVRQTGVALQKLQQRPCNHLVPAVDASCRGLPKHAGHEHKARTSIRRKLLVRRVGGRECHRSFTPEPPRQIHA